MRKQVKEIKFHQALITVILMTVLMFASVVGSGADPQIPLVFSCMIAGITAFLNGYSWDDILEGMLNGIHRSLEAILILCLIGILVGVWIASGTVPTMIYYGLRLVSADFFLAASMLVCTLVALIIGSWGTIGTIGLAFMGIGLALGLPAPLVAGSIVSGAYLGEIASPLSDATNLTAAVVGDHVFTIIRRLIKICALVFPVTLCAYLLLGMGLASASDGQITANMEPLLTSLHQEFRIGVPALLPMVIMVICILIKSPAIPSMLAGILCGMAYAVLGQGAMPGDLLNVSYMGYISSTGQELLDHLLTAGGLESMMYSISVIIIAMGFGGIMQSTGQMHALIGPLAKKIKTSGGLGILVTGTCIAMNGLLPDQYLGISVPGQMYSEEYTRRGESKSELGGLLLAGGAVSSPLIPWNTCGVYVASILGVGAFQYAPYAFLCLLMPVAVVAAGFRKF
ncbi:Na+/H+ antiporter NhaC family protein [Enterocloster asparagiformis]|uniref:Na+/H+ antiporter NhaC family protein n=1 Tax=Enterocloster asparagiformis TaxID=333367 RepID=UPI002A801FD5|nr:Na+/H+ antiporter NhaC family protein [Enterocloster asparagiformis]